MFLRIKHFSTVTAVWKKVNFAQNRLLHRGNTEYGVSRTGFEDYEKERAIWSVTIPQKFNFASDVLDVWSQKEKDGQRSTSVPAYWFVYENGKEIKWSFQELERKSKKVANMLLSYGVKRGDPVMVMLPKIPEFWLLNVAAMRIGAVLCPATTQLTAKDLAYRLSTYQPTCFIIHESVAQVLEEATSSCKDMKKIVVCDEPRRIRKGMTEFYDLYNTVEAEHECVKTDSDEVMMVFFTSGTTGYPKMVEHTHSSYGIGHRTTALMMDVTSENILWNISDPGWAKTAYTGIFASWIQGACVFVGQLPRFDPVHILQTLKKYPIDTLCAPPTVYRMMVQEDLKSYKFKALEHCTAGGEGLNAEITKLWKEETGLNIYQCYGQTETVVLIGMHKCIKYKVESLGKPSPGINVVIVDDNENEVEPGVEGEIVVKRPEDGKIFGLFKEYRNEPEVTKERLTDKYFHTGDLGYYDEEGYFYFAGRKDDVINSAGYRIGPFEVESALMEHPAVAEVAVASSPDEKRGEVVKAFIVLRNDYKVESESELIKELQEHTKRTTAPYKYPRKIEFVTQLPKTVSGKVQRFELRKKEWAGHKK